MHRHLGFCISASLALGCTFTDGEGFVTLEHASLSLAFEPGEARDLGNQTLLTDLGYQVALSSMTLAVDEVRLEERQGGAATGSFDPANPPAGFSLCHGGHCHSDDGRLVSYEEIEAQLAGGQVSFSPVVRFPVERDVDVLADPVVRLERIEPSHELPQAALARAAVALGGCAIDASVQGGSLTTPVPLRVELGTLGAVTVAIDARIDRDAPERLELSAKLSVDGTLFDDIDFASLISGAPLELTEPDDAAVIVLVQNVLSSDLQVRFTETGD